MTPSAPPGARLLRVVLDTNVVVSSLLSATGAPARVIDAWRALRILPVVSEAVLEEIRATLSYPRLRQKYALTDEAVADVLALLRRDALVVPGKLSAAGAVPEDPSDEMFLACAVEGQADMIVSGDQHLLRLGTYHGIPIVTVHRLLEELGLD